jgi:hypothetical protein
MLDQSFSAHNFRTIIQVLNRKGIYVEGHDRFDNDVFFKSRAESVKLPALNEKLILERIRLANEAKATGTKFDIISYRLLKQTNDEAKKEVHAAREEILSEILENIAKSINSKSYKVGINKGGIKWGKQLYVSNNIAEDFLALKQIQYNLKKSFKVQPSNRNIIINQIITILNDDFPKVILRADIKSFYESICHGTLISKLNHNTILSSPSKKIIKDVLNKYWKLLIADGLKSEDEKRIGVPRGIGISAYLAEIYMRDFDNAVRQLEDVSYYARYVDDIVIVFTPKSRFDTKTLEEYTKKIKDILQVRTALEVNFDKTELIDLRPLTSSITVPKIHEFTFLGYRFSFKYVITDFIIHGKVVKKTKLEELKVCMSISRRDRYKNRLQLAFEAYRTKVVSQKKAANRLLIKRVKYLTGNTKLVGNKSNVFVGIYFSNIQLSYPSSDLEFLNEVLKNEINSLPITESYLIGRLSKFDFNTGYKEKSFSHYSITKLNKILSIWN